MAVCRIHDDNIHMGVDQGLHALHHIGGNADAGAAEQTSLIVLCGEGIFDLLLNILDGNQTFQIVVVIHDGEFLFLAFARIAFASSRVMPTFAVIRFSEVMDSLIFLEKSVSNFRSRLVMIPTSLPFSVMGTPEMRNFAIRLLASSSVCSGER